MNYTITDASAYILQKLAYYSHGTVHSVYRKTINFSFGDHLAALQAEKSPLSPISLITPLTAGEMASLPVCAGYTVKITPDGLQIGSNCTFELGQVSPQELQLTHTLPQDDLPFLEKHILTVLRTRDAGSFDLLFSDTNRAEQIPFLAAVKKFLSHASHSLIVSDWEEGAKALVCLIGLGIGLTPGGDDFLCGVLAGLILCGITDHPFAHALRREISEHLTDTNEISAAFLQCALEGQFSQAVNSLNSIPSYSQILTVFSAIGHSSGTDTLCGIAYLMQNRRLLGK